MGRRRRGGRVRDRDVVRRRERVVDFPHVLPPVVRFRRPRRVEVVVVPRRRVKRPLVRPIRRFIVPTPTKMTPKRVNLRSGVVLARERKLEGRQRCVRAKSVRRHMYFKSGRGSPRPPRREHAC